MRTTGSLLAICFLFPTATLSGQQPDAIEIGQRVRVTAPTCSLVEQVGRFQGMRDRTMVLSAGSSSFECPLRSVTSLEASQGRYRSATKAQTYGLLGAAVGVIAGVVLMDGLGIIGPIMLGASGAATGALVGASPRDRWEAVPTSQLQGSRARQRGAVAIGLRVPFR